MQNEISYQTPVGTFRTYNEAHDACMRCDYDPALCITVIRG